MNPLRKVRLALRNKKMKRPTLFTKKISINRKKQTSKLGVVHFITQMIKRTDEPLLSIPMKKTNIIPYSKRVIKFIKLLGIKN